MLIKVLITVVGLFFLIVLESFFNTLFSFSILIIALLLLIDKIDWKRWVLIASLSTVLIDILLLRPMGVTLLVLGVISVLLYTLFLIVPKKEVILSYIPYLFAIWLYYILLDLAVPYLQDRVWGTLSWESILVDMVISIISTITIFLINLLVNNFRSKEDLRL
jgi:hypothetical protein